MKYFTLTIKCEDNAIPEIIGATLISCGEAFVEMGNPPEGYNELPLDTELKELGLIQAGVHYATDEALDAKVTRLKEDFDMLKTGDWVPDPDSVDASIDTCDEILKAMGGFR